MALRSIREEVDAGSHVTAPSARGELRARTSRMGLSASVAPGSASWRHMASIIGCRNRRPSWRTSCCLGRSPPGSCPTRSSTSTPCPAPASASSTRKPCVPPTPASTGAAHWRMARTCRH